MRLPRQLNFSRAAEKLFLTQPELAPWNRFDNLSSRRDRDFFSFGLWVHHMFATGLPQLGTTLFFPAGSMMIAAVPFDVC